VGEADAGVKEAEDQHSVVDCGRLWEEGDCVGVC